MEIEVAQEKLSKALSVVSRVAGGRTGLPVLNNVLIRVDEGKVSLTTTNLDMAVVDYVPVRSAANGVVTVPAKLVAEFVSNLPKGETLKLTVEGGTKMRVAAGQYNSLFNGILADEFPELPEIDEGQAVSFRLGVPEFKLGISEVVGCASNDTTRPALTGVYFNTFEGALFAASTDGYRLAERKLGEKFEAEVASIVPSSTLGEVLRAIDDSMEEIEICFDENFVRFRMGEVEIISKLIDARYPDYRRLLPEKNEVKFTIGKSELVRAMKLASLFARGSGGSVVWNVIEGGSKLSVAAVVNELGDNDTVMEIGATVEGRATFNSRYILDALNALEEETVAVEMAVDKVTPILIMNEKNRDYKHIIMPIRA